MLDVAWTKLYLYLCCSNSCVHSLQSWAESPGFWWGYLNLEAVLEGLMETSQAFLPEWVDILGSKGKEQTHP